MLKMIENYSQLANRILDYAIKQENIHQCGEGDIYEINNDPNVKFPIFWMSSTQPVQELDNYWVYNLTFYYVDRLLIDSPREYSTNSINISSAGISILSNIIRKIKQDDDIYKIDSAISYSTFNDTQVFADHCAGVFCNVSLTVPKYTNCVS